MEETYQLIEGRRRCATWTRRTASCGARSGVLSAGMTEVS